MCSRSKGLQRSSSGDILLGKWNAFVDANILQNLDNLVITLYTLCPVKPFLLRFLPCSHRIILEPFGPSLKVEKERYPLSDMVNRLLPCVYLGYSLWWSSQPELLNLSQIISETSSAADAVDKRDESDCAAFLRYLHGGPRYLNGKCRWCIARSREL
jgi:hypothetical protein|uniref:Uncharacterized protein n=5 Tax=Populus TaxID=3689 RepID=A0A451FPL8_POPAL|nr:hypothetical protein [Populus davidiana]YP_009560702.1 hypothetical protein [Populus alba]ALP00629.1 hypothetical protein [Populus tremula]ALP46561.1 hypothetical protein [Populus tremula x Populus alba]QTG40215.1 hypothetical protein [Populus rotundifolia var. duclouxiana]UZA66002.1 hypothetical protein Potri.00MG000040 [Populus trichocarpa]ARX79206.1 hypothetical protein [Populus davidiana]